MCLDSLSSSLRDYLSIIFAWNSFDNSTVPQEPAGFGTRSPDLVLQWRNDQVCVLLVLHKGCISYEQI
jgi:hypothetical protein